MTGEFTTAFSDGAVSCGAGCVQFADAATVRSRGVEKSVGQPFAKWASTYQVDGPLGRLIVAEVDCVVVAITGAAPELAIQRSYDVAFAAADHVKVTGLAMFAAPAAGVIAEGAALLHDGCALMVIDTLALLLFPSGSLLVPTSEALSPALPLEAAVAVMVRGAAGPTGRDGSVQTIVRPDVKHDQPLPEAVGVVTPKRLLIRRTPCATLGPLFAAFRVKVMVSPGLAGFGLPVIVSARSAESRATVALPEAEQEPLVTTTLILTLAPLPAVQVIDGVPLPLVIVPPVIDQA